MSYKPTGYPRGRPRKGEIRPPSPQSEYRQNWRKNRVAQDPSYLELERQWQIDWNDRHPGLANYQRRMRNIRNKALEECVELRVTGPFSVQRTD